MQQLYFWLSNKYVLIFLIISNLLGTLYGYYWYLGQLKETQWYFMPFVPDSPTASLFLVIALIYILLGRHSGLFEALAFVTLIKYGVWAVAMNIFAFIELGEVTEIGLMLCISHGIMAIEALLFLPFFKIKKWHILATLIWVFHNDVVDYVYMQYPVYSMLSQYIRHIGYFAFWLTVIPVVMLWYCFIDHKYLT
ncbi:DUF1405 domain-containing protein [Macrococcus hajekii]|uniref:DUF1405 domain-containing protein n=1 Tax=Macrococcus hajekii TaxID=198482 RepID=A0A4R6BME5_9STAP|nr:DUF1405 domain-containing protein [Macrococcus hajekii]TDM02993.1 DUF1405 domain-containing protein [Macrococcus hajekii]GGB05631.1 membrane protein [Macrococcus hajekii]